MEGSKKSNNPMRKLFLLFSSFLLLVGACAGGLINRLYFLHGGQRIWLSGWLQSVGCPIILLPLTATYMNRRRAEGPTAKLFLMKPCLFLYAAMIGLIFGAINYLYGFGSSKLPVSTMSLIYACQLVFTAVFSFMLVKQKFTPYSINTVVLLTVGAAALALNASSDKPEGESTKEYAMGFVMTVLAAVVNGLVLPLMELAYKKSNQEMTYTLAMEFDLVMCIFSTAFSTVGMLINHDFRAMAREATEYDLGEVIYYTVLFSSAVAWQCTFVGLNGVIFYASSLLSGVLVALTIPITQVLAVIFYHEKFQGQKGLSLVLSTWGFVSYFYGEIKKSRNLAKHGQNQPQAVELGPQQKDPKDEITLQISQ